MYLEYSCHGLVWIGGVFAFLYLLPSWMELWSNLLLLLFLDIVFVAVVKVIFGSFLRVISINDRKPRFCTFKAFTRRRRPGYNQGKMFVTVGPDKFSFPSGHATRAVALALFFGIAHPPIHSIVALPVFTAWAVAVCLSRVLLGRHHILDVGGGVAIGALEYALATMLAIGPDAAEGLRQYLFDDDPWSSG